MRDRRLIFVAVVLRALGTGMMGVLLGLYLARRGFSAETMGVLVAAGLAGAAVAALLATLSGERLGRKRFLVAVSLLGAAGGAAFAFGRDPWVLGALAFGGMLNGMGRDRGAALILEQAILPGTTPDAGRTRVFAWYNVLQDVGQAAGALLAGLPQVLQSLRLAGEAEAFRAAFVLYALLLLAAGLAYLPLSASAEAPARAGPVAISPESRRILWKISALFALDSLGGGFLTKALLSYFFHERFGAGGGLLGLLFFLAGAANALSHLGAAWLARKIGLVNTMVFTHIPSSFLLITIPFAPHFWAAAALFLLREGLVEMDVPTRQSYVMAVVRPEERTFASGVTHLVRMGSWAVAPSLAGLFMKGVLQAAPLFVGAGLKIVYDILLFAAFRHLKPPEERGVN